MTGCPVCGQTLAPTCPNRLCRRRDRHVSVVFSAGVHKGSLRGAIVRYKYRGDQALLPALARTLASFVTSHETWLEEFDVLTAVPAYTGAGARRRWDPVGSLLAALAERLPDWRVEPQLVVKQAETPPMTGLPWSARQSIAAGPLRDSLEVPDPVLVEGRQVLVVDDVLTEGATLDEVARALRRAGATDVAGLVLARLPWLPDPPDR